VGDLDKPKMAFFFEEAHLLFADAPPALLQKIEQVVRLIRSKGVGVYFITQNPDDVPETVLAQLGNRVQHALRAFTPREQKAVRTAAETLRPNPAIDTRTAIGELGVGEALVSFLDDRGSPTMVERAWVLPPASRIGPITAEERRAVINGSIIGGHYEQTVDRESAYETLRNRAEAGHADAAAAPAEAAAADVPRQRSAPAPRSSSGGGIADILLGSTGPRGGRREGILESAARSAARSVGSGMAREIMRGVLGSLLGRRR
jgi:DNA helicase HerA-like ATPase